MIRNEEDHNAEVEDLDAMVGEILTFNMQDATAQDHIGAAEAQLAYYERSIAVMSDAVEMSEGTAKITGEGSLEFIRHAATMHIAIAHAMNVDTKRGLI